MLQFWKGGDSWLSNMIFWSVILIIWWLSYNHIIIIMLSPYHHIIMIYFWKGHKSKWYYGLSLLSYDDNHKTEKTKFLQCFQKNKWINDIKYDVLVCHSCRMMTIQHANLVHLVSSHSCTLYHGQVHIIIPWLSSYSYTFWLWI